jgi:formate--tetrahydrofolate ligase
MAKAINPNLMQTIEGQPVLVHAGPFANIAIGQSSIIADRVGLKLADYHVTESGFGADIGFEKFWNLKCRAGGLVPNCSVVVCTLRALKMHGGGPRVVPGRPLDRAYTEAAPELVERGVANLAAHVATVRRSGVPAVVCVNHFHTDTDAEVAVVDEAARALGVPCVVSRHWRHGGEGARALAEAVVAACETPVDFRYLYPETLPLRARIERITTEVYGGAGVSYEPDALAKVAAVERDPALARLGTCMAKTHLSLSHDPALKGRPTGWELPVRDLLLYHGAGLAVPVAGDVKLMPGTASDPAFRRIDVDPATGRVRGLH